MAKHTLATVMTLAVAVTSATADSSVDFHACERAAQDWTPAREREHMLQCGTAVREFVRASRSAVDRARVWALFDRLPARSSVRRSALLALLEQRLASVAEGLPEPARDTAPPVADVEAELDAARADYRRLRAAFDAARASPRSRTHSYLEHGGEFEQTLANYARGRVTPEKTLAGLARFQWGSWCGFGSDVFTEPLGLAIAAAAGELGRYDVAAGALLTWRFRWRFMFDWDDDVPRQRMIAAAGYDWERVVLGALLAGEGDAAEMLARRGSARVAGLLLAAAPQPQHPLAQETAPLADAASFLSALALFVEQGGACGGNRVYVSLRDVSRTGEPAPAAVQRDILHLLAGRVAPGVPRQVAVTTAHLLTSVCRPESLPAFRVMARSPFTQVRELGTTALAAFGESVTETPPNPPVVFRIVVDGAPLSDVPLRWYARDGRGRSVSSFDSRATASQGRVDLERDPFLDVAAPVGTVELSALDPKDPSDLWFSAERIAPADLDAVSTIEIATQSLTVRCAEARADRVELQLVDAARPTIAYRRSLGGERPFVMPEIAFPRLQQGHAYRVRLLGTGGWSWTSESVALGATPVVLDCARPSAR